MAIVEVCGCDATTAVGIVGEADHRRTLIVSLPYLALMLFSFFQLRSGRQW